jgi:hypothetical protein
MVILIPHVVFARRAFIFQTILHLLAVHAQRLIPFVLNVSMICTVLFARLATLEIYVILVQLAIKILIVEFVLLDTI